jgi:hypothetical protein
VVFSSALFANPAGAELAKWDQTRVTEIAQQLTKASDAWWQAVLEQPGGPMGEGDDSGLVEKAQVLQEQSRTLAAHLAKGKGHDETRNMYRSLKETVDDTEVEARRTELDEPTLDAWAKVTDLLRQIAPYYDPKALDE